MADPISTFFDAWQHETSIERFEKINKSVTDDVQYDDPRTPQTVNGKDALNDYVGMFSANAPGWSATVISSDTTAGMTRATIAFGGIGPDGKEMIQLGQYFIEIDGNLISRMVGFVGNGTDTEK